MAAFLGSYRIFEIKNYYPYEFNREIMVADYFQNLRLEDKIDNILRRVDDHIYYNDQDSSLQSFY